MALGVHGCSYSNESRYPSTSDETFSSLIRDIIVPTTTPEVLIVVFDSALAPDDLS